MSWEAGKEAAAKYAIDTYAKSDTVIGLGTGSTATYAVKFLADKILKKEIVNVKCVSTSSETEKLAKSLGIQLVSRDEVDTVDIAFDGADEVDDELNLVKGRGGALLREKIVEEDTKLIVLIDESKLCKKVGLNGALPVEIVQFAYEHIVKKIAALPCLKNSCTTKIRENKSGGKFITDNGNFIVDLFLKTLESHPSELALQLLSVVGVVEHGLFIQMATVCVCADSTGKVKIINKKKEKL